MILPFTILYIISSRKKLSARDSILLITALVIATSCYFYLRNGMNPLTDSGLMKVMSNKQPVLSIVVDDLAACGFYIRKMICPIPLNFAITKIPVTINLVLFGVTVPILLYLYNKQKTLIIPILVVLAGFIQPLLALNGRMSWTPYAERYIYISMTGFSILVGFSLIHYARKLPFAVLLAGVLLISIPTIYRVAEWADPVRFWQSTVLKTPDLATVRLLLAKELINNGRYEEAESQLFSAKSIGLRREVDRITYGEFLAALEKMKN